MKKYIRLSFLLAALVLSVVLLNGCNASTDETETDVSIYSVGIDGNGYWEGIDAHDYVEDFEYDGITIPAEEYEVTDDYLQSQIDTLMEGYITRIEITDRPVAEGDTVNIDYDGKIDGVYFEGGSTMEVGVDVVIGESNGEDSEDMLSFLDGFLETLVGRMPGESLEIEVTFPDDYYEETLRGQEAVFETTINYIVEREELTDEFVNEKMSGTYGWTTVEEMREGVKADIQRDLIEQYIANYLMTEVTVTSYPDSMMEYEENVLMLEYQGLADYNNITVEEYLQEFEGYDSIDECLEDARDTLEENITYSLAAQAVAEDLNLTVTEEDMETYSAEHLWSSDISIQADYYGLPYVKQAVLIQKVIDYIAENAVLG